MGVSIIYYCITAPVLLAELLGPQQLVLAGDAGPEIRDPGEVLPSADKGALVPQRLVQVQPVARHSTTNAALSVALLLCQCIGITI